MRKRVIIRTKAKPPKKSSPVSKPSPAPDVAQGAPIPPADTRPEPAPGFLRPSPFSGHALPASTLWPKGVVQNPGGAPKGKRITSWLAEFGEIPAEDWPEEGSAAWKRLPGNATIALAQLRRAQDKGDGLPAAMWAADRVEGGVDRTVHLTHKQEPTMSLEDAAEMVKQAKLDTAPQAEEF